GAVAVRRGVDAAADRLDRPRDLPRGPLLRSPQKQFGSEGGQPRLAKRIARGAGVRHEEKADERQLAPLGRDHPQAVLEGELDARRKLDRPHHAASGTTVTTDRLASRKSSRATRRTSSGVMA